MACYYSFLVLLTLFFAVGSVISMNSKPPLERKSSSDRIEAIIKAEVEELESRKGKGSCRQAAEIVRKKMERQNSLDRIKKWGK